MTEIPLKLFSEIIKFTSAHGKELIAQLPLSQKKRRRRANYGYRN